MEVDPVVTICHQDIPEVEVKISLGEHVPHQLLLALVLGAVVHVIQARGDGDVRHLRQEQTRLTWGYSGVEIR